MCNLAVGTWYVGCGRQRDMVTADENTYLASQMIYVCYVYLSYLHVDIADVDHILAATYIHSAL